MKYLTSLPALFLVAACATPQEQCINTASNQVQVLQNGIAKAQGNISRGHAIHKHREEYQVADICYDKEKKPYTCYDTEYRTIETPVSIDMNEERKKLADLKRRLPAAKRKMLTDINSCRVAYPE